MTDFYTVSTWTVKAGREDDFVAVWRGMVEATTDEFPTAKGRLLRDIDNPGRFVSIGPWPSLETIDEWRASPPFLEGVARLRELVDAFEPGTYEMSVEVPAQQLDVDHRQSFGLRNPLRS